MSNPVINKLIEGILKECTPKLEEEITLHAMANNVMNNLNLLFLNINLVL